MMKVSRAKMWSIIAVALLLVVFVVVKNKKPTVIINYGAFTTSDVFGPTSVRANSIVPGVYLCKITFHHVRSFNSGAYKERFPYDIVLRGTILTNDPENIRQELSTLGVNWVRIKIRNDVTGQIKTVYDKKFLGFL